MDRGQRLLLSARTVANRNIRGETAAKTAAPAGDSTAALVQATAQTDRYQLGEAVESGTRRSRC